MPVHDRSSFENLYAGQPRWEIGQPQQAFLNAADQIAGQSHDGGNPKVYVEEATFALSHTRSR